METNTKIEEFYTKRFSFREHKEKQEEQANLG